MDNNPWDAYYEWRLKDCPEYATIVGRHEYNQTLDDHSEEAFVKRESVYRQFLEKHSEFLEKNPDLDALEKSESALNHAVFMHEIEEFLAGIRFKAYLLPLNNMEGPHVDFPQIISFTAFNSETDYRNYFTRLSRFPQKIDQIIGLMQTGETSKKQNKKKTYW